MGGGGGVLSLIVETEAAIYGLGVGLVSGELEADRYKIHVM